MPASSRVGDPKAYRPGTQATSRLPPQDVPDVEAGACAEHTPFQLQTPTVHLNGARLQLGYCLQPTRGQSTNELQHNPIHHDGQPDLHVPITARLRGSWSL